MWYEQVFVMFLFVEKCDLPFGSKLNVGAGSNGLGTNPRGNEPSNLGWWGTSSEKKKKKSELLEKLNANSKFLVEMKEDLERMKRYFYSRAATQGFDEEHPAGSDAVGVSGGRDDALHVNAEEGNIEADNTAAADAQRNANAIDSEQILVDATNEIDEAVEVVVASKLESTNIGATSQSKNGASHGSPEVPTFGIEEAKNTTERAPSAEEEKTVEEHKDAIDSSLSDDALIIVEALTFVS